VVPATLAIIAATFDDGYQAGLLATVALVAAGAVVSFVALRRLGGQGTLTTQAVQAPEPAMALSGAGQAADLAPADPVR
jgi:UPF0716 family protein affecting phage T7 exclusion